MNRGIPGSIVVPLLLLTLWANAVLAQLPCNRSATNSVILTCPSTVPTPRCDESGNIVGCECYRNKRTNVTKINCRRANLTSIPDIESIEIWDELDLGMTNITSIPADSFNGVRVRHINFFLCEHLTVIKANAFRGASYVDFLEITNTGLEIVEDYAFNGAGEMRIINMMSNFIRNITRSAFEGMPLLNTTRLDYNFIDYVHPNAFSKLNNLLTLSISNNKIKDLPNGVLDGLEYLEYLKLAENEIEEIPDGIFKHTKNLKTLNLWRNAIHSLSPGSFDGLVKLSRLDIRDNNLTSLPRDLLKTLSSLEELNLAENRLQTIPDNIFAHQQNMWYLDLAKNELKNVPNAIKRLKGLQQVDLSFNEIKEVAPFAFEGLNLKRINLGTYKTAMNITDQSFCGVNNSLQFLDLSFSKLLQFTGTCSFADLFNVSVSGKLVEMWNNTVVCDCNFRDFQVGLNCSNSTGDNLKGCRIQSFTQWNPLCSRGGSVMQGTWDSCLNYTVNCTSVCDREEEVTTVGKPTTGLTTDASATTGRASATTKPPGGGNGSADTPDNSPQIAAIISGSIGATIVIIFIICCLVYLSKKRIEAFNQRANILYATNGSNQNYPIINSEFDDYDAPPRKISSETKTWQTEADQHFENKPHSPYCNANSNFPWPFDTTKT